MSLFAPSLDTGAVIVDDASGHPESGHRSDTVAETCLVRWYGEVAEFFHVSTHPRWCVALDDVGSNHSLRRPRPPVFSTWGDAETWLAHQPPALVASCSIEPYG